MTEALSLGTDIVVADRSDHAARLSQAVSLVRRMDAWSSDVTGIGTRARDKAFDATFGPALYLSEQELEALCDGNGMAARICEIPGDRAMQKGVQISITPDKARATELSSAVTKKLEQLGIVALVGEGCFWRRGLGGGAIYIDADDGLRPDQPLLETRIRSVRALRYYSKSALKPASYYADERHPKYDTPATYYLSPQNIGAASAFSIVHESRLAVIDGMRVSPTRRRQNQGWGGSILVRIFEELRNYGLGWAATTQLMQTSSQAVYTMRGLIDGVADGHKSSIEERMALVELYRSIARAVLLDAGDMDGKGAEKFELHSVDWGGLAPVLDLFAQVICAVTGYPMTVLFGRSPAGMNASGESDQQTMDALVETEQEQTIKPAVTRVAQIVMLAKDGPTRGVLPAQWEVQFPPLRVMTATQQADLRKTQAETDALEIANQMITPEEAAVSRHRAEGWSGETQIDLEARHRLMEAEQDTDEAMRAEGDPAKATQVGDPKAPKPGAATGTAADPNAPPVPEEAKDPSTALNGAQVTAMQEIVTAVATKELPRATGVEMMLAAFPLKREQAEAIMGDVGRTFFVDKPTPPPFGGGLGAKAPAPNAAPPPGAPAEDDDAEDEAGAETAPGAPAQPARPKRIGARAPAPREDRREPDGVIRLDAQDGHTGAMVALFLDPATAARFAIPGGTPAEDLHITLAYLGPAAEIHPIALASLRMRLHSLARYQSGPMQAWLSGVGTFAPSAGTDGAPCHYLSVDAPWLPGLRESVMAACQMTPGITPSEGHGFTPHVTVGYGDVGASLVRAPVPIMIGELVLVVGETREHFTLGAGADAVLTSEQTETVTAVLAKVTSGALPRETGVELIEASTRMPRAQVEQLVGDIGRAIAPSRKQGD